MLFEKLFNKSWKFFHGQPLKIAFLFACILQEIINSKGSTTETKLRIFENLYLQSKLRLTRRENYGKPFSHNFSQHVQILCLKNQHAKNQIVCLTATFTIALQKDKVKVSHAKTNQIFWSNENASTEPHNNPINFL